MSAGAGGESLFAQGDATCICNATVIYTGIHSWTHLLNVSIQAEEVEDAGAVHLGWMKATDHGHGAGGVASVRG